MEAPKALSIRWLRFSPDGGYLAMAAFTNSPPVAGNNSGSTNKNSAVSIAVLTNETDANKDALSVMNLGGVGHGTVALNANGTATYTPPPARRWHFEINGSV